MRKEKRRQVRDCLTVLQLWDDSNVYKVGTLSPDNALYRMLHGTLVTLLLRKKNVSLRKKKEKKTSMPSIAVSRAEDEIATARGRSGAAARHVAALWRVPNKESSRPRHVAYLTTFSRTPGQPSTHLFHGEAASPRHPFLLPPCPCPEGETNVRRHGFLARRR